MYFPDFVVRDGKDLQLAIIVKHEDQIGRFVIESSCDNLGIFKSLPKLSYRINRCRQPILLPMIEAAESRLLMQQPPIIGAKPCTVRK